MKLQNSPKVFADWLNQRLDDLGISGAELAKKAGTSPAYVSQLRTSSKTNPSRATIKRLAQALNSPAPEISVEETSPDRTPSLVYRCDIIRGPRKIHFEFRERSEELVLIVSSTRGPADSLETFKKEIEVGPNWRPATFAVENGSINISIPIEPLHRE